MVSKGKISMQSQSIKQFFKDTVNEKTSLKSKVIYLLIALSLSTGYSEIGYDKGWWQADKLHQIIHGALQAYYHKR